MEDTNQFKKLSKIEKRIIELGIDIAKDGDGALFIISDKINYKRLYGNNYLKPCNILTREGELRIMALSRMDGAFIISNKGYLQDYGAKIHANKILKGFGTRHAAAVSASSKDATAILVSQEERRVKLFRKGKLILQIDALDKHVKEDINEINNVLQSLGFGTAASLTSTLMVATGITAVSMPIATGIILFGIPYYAYKRWTER